MIKNMLNPKYNRDLLASSVIVIFVLALGSFLRIWAGDLKGDDAYFHLGEIQYVIDNFPHISWFSQSFAGYSSLQFSAITYNCVVAAAHVFTRLPIQVLAQACLLVSLVALGISVYVLARILSIPRIPAVGFSLLMFTTSLTLNWVVIGGAYVRLAALPFLFLSVALVYRHTRQINDSSEKFGTYCATVVVLTIMAMLHPLIWQWAFIMLVTIYLFGIRSWPRRFYHLVKTFLPVAGLVAWLYVPMFTAYRSVMSPLVSGASAHDTTLMEWKWLVHIPLPGNWSTDIGPILLPLAILSLIFMATYQLRTRDAARHISLEQIIATVTSAFSVYFFAFGWLPMPKSLYLMAAYDYAMFFAISLLLLSLFAFPTLARLLSSLELRNHSRTALHTFFLIVVIGSTIATVPFLRRYTQTGNPRNENEWAYAVSTIVDVAQSNAGLDYRLFSTQRRLTSWIHYTDPDIQITGGRTNNSSPHKYCSQWADSTVSYRLNMDDVSSISREDQPQVTRVTLGGQENFYSSMFWLDWYGASGPILLPSFYPQERTSHGYASRPQFFQQFETDTSIGDLSFYRYRDSSPITVSTEAHVLAVPFQPGDAPQFYTDLLDVLSALNLNSQWIVPVKLDDGENLSNFDTALVEYERYVMNRDILDSFAKDGGHLIVMGVNTSQYATLTAQLQESGLAFQVEASPLLAPDGSSVQCAAQELSLVYTTSQGYGSLTFSGISLRGLVESNSAVSAVLLAQVIAPEIEVNQADAELSSSTVLPVTMGTTVTGFRVSPSGPDQEASLIFALDQSVAHNQISWILPLPQQVPADSNAIIHVSLWNDGVSASSIEVALKQDSDDGYLYYELPQKLWTGWQDFSLPLSYFQRREDEQIDNFDSVVLSFSVDAAHQSNPEAREFRVKYAGVSSLGRTSSYSSLYGEWKQANKFTLTLGDEKRILWKETHVSSWQVTDDNGHRVSYYYAGPGMIYVVAPSDASSLTFQMPVPKDQIVGIVVSVVSLVGFSSYLVVRRLRKKRDS